MKIFIIISSLLLISCSSNNTNYDKADSEINKYFTEQAESFFGNILENKMSFSSYSSDDVSYTIPRNWFDFNIILNDKEQILKANGWYFHKKYNQSYIFCKGIDQLEIIPPRSKVGNKIIMEGSSGMQLENEWNILFAHPKNSTWFECNKDN